MLIIVIRYTFFGMVKLVLGSSGFVKKTVMNLGGSSLLKI